MYHKLYIFRQTFHRQNFYFIYLMALPCRERSICRDSGNVFVSSAVFPPLLLRNWILRLLLLFHPCSLSLSCPTTPRSSTFSSAALLPPREGWEVCLASWLGNRFSCGQKYDYGVERSGTLLSPGLIGCSPLPTGPALFVNGKRVMGILCRIVLRGTIVVASEAVFIGLSSSASRRIPVIFGEEKPVAIRVLSSRLFSSQFKI